MTQPGVHPDAESLSAFAEQALPVAERQQVMEHLAFCGRCREVVFLTQDAAGAETDLRPAASEAGPSRWWQKWFSGWRLAWVPAAALAGVVGFAVLHHARNEQTPTEVARSTPHEEALSDAVTKPTPDSKATQPKQLDKKESRAKEDEEPGQRRTMTAVNAPKPMVSQEPLRDDAAPVPASIPPEIAGAPPEAQGRSADRLATQKRSNTGGPVFANDAQQQTEGSQQPTKDQLHNAQYAAKSAAIAPPPPAQGLGRAASQNATVSVAAAPAREQVQAEMNSGFASAGDEVASDLKKKAIVLPTGARSRSSATVQGRTVAIDSSGAVFFSETSGQWTPVAAPWTGRAVFVRSVHSAGVGGGQSAQNPVFELVTDKPETWVSIDGKTWAAKPLPQN
jgi:Putative zinc-finger